jgi:transcription initiation factor TFIIIB Brf1 subunit/transcription initiation factor TFIIB
MTYDEMAKILEGRCEQCGAALVVDWWDFTYSSDFATCEIFCSQCGEIVERKTIALTYPAQTIAGQQLRQEWLNEVGNAHTKATRLAGGDSWHVV